MRRRWKVFTAACAVAMGLCSGTALAHPPVDYGTPLSSPFGWNFSFIANFQTAQNPFNAANTHVTSSDIAFWGDLAYVGDYGGFRIFDVSKPEPTLVKDVRCYGPQGDPSVFDTDKDGDADTLVLSVDSVLAGPRLRRPAGQQERDDRAASTRTARGRACGSSTSRTRPPRRRSRPSTRTAARTPTRCSPHRAASRCTCSTRAIRSARARPAARSVRPPVARSTTASCRSSRCRSTIRPQRSEVDELHDRLPR